jgi:DUF4097 and DUF4098 domain-containing protein YvlB
MRTLLMTGVFGFSVMLAGCDIEDFESSDRFQTEFHYTYPLRDGGTLNLESFNGSVEITGWNQNTVEISGSKYGSTEQLRDSIKIDVSHTDSSVSIRAVRPFENHGNMGARFVVKVPRKTQLDRIVSSNGHIEVHDVSGKAVLHTSNGRVNAIGVDGPIDITSSNGHITVEESDSGKYPISLRTSNGPIEIRADKPILDELHASTSNGSITLRLAPATAARVRASTSNASITSDFDVTGPVRMDKHHLEGTLNNARSDAPLIDLSTSNGSIRISRL